MLIIGSLDLLSYLWPHTVSIFGEKYPDEVETLYVTQYPINASKEWINELGKFKKLKVVVIEGQTIPQKERNYLKELYPSIRFEVVALIDVYEQQIREDEKYIDLSDSSVDFSLVELLEAFPNLRKVNLGDQVLDQQLQLALMEKYPAVTFEWQVDVLGQKVNYDTTELDLSQSKIEDLETFTNALKLLPYLTYLDMSNCNLTNEQLGNLREQFPQTKIVWIIRMGKWSLRTDAIAFSVWITDFRYVRLKSPDIEVLKYCTDLRALDLGHQALTDISVIGEYLPDLRVLILADNQISDISPIAKLKHLHYLELFMNKITDLSPLVENKELVDLNLGHIYTLADISPLLNNDFPLLERLWVMACRIPQRDLQKTREKYTNVKIVTVGSGSTGSGWRTHKRYYAMIDMFRKRTYISEEFTKYDQ